MRRRLLVAELQVYQGFSEFWVADPGKKRGLAPTIISGPYASRDRCEQAIRDLRESAGSRCPTCSSPSRARMGQAPCIDVWHYGGTEWRWFRVLYPIRRWMVIREVKRVIDRRRNMTSEGLQVKIDEINRRWDEVRRKQGGQ